MKLSTKDPPPCIRLALVEEASALSKLCIRSKAVWGYDKAFMARARVAPEVKPKQTAAGEVRVASLWHMRSTRHGAGAPSG
jgi:hypothetical protein